MATHSQRDATYGSRILRVFWCKKYSFTGNAITRTGPRTSSIYTTRSRIFPRAWKNCKRLSERRRSTTPSTKKSGNRRCCREALRQSRRRDSGGCAHGCRTKGESGKTCGNLASGTERNLPFLAHFLGSSRFGVNFTGRTKNCADHLHWRCPGPAPIKVGAVEL